NAVGDLLAFFFGFHGNTSFLPAGAGPCCHCSVKPSLCKWRCGKEKRPLGGVLPHGFSRRYKRKRKPNSVVSADRQSTRLNPRRVPYPTLFRSNAVGDLLAFFFGFHGNTSFLPAGAGPCCHCSVKPSLCKWRCGKEKRPLGGALPHGFSRRYKRKRKPISVVS